MMNSLGLNRCALGFCIAIAALAGCGGLRLPIAAPDTMPQSRTVAAQAAHRKSWMAPDAKKDDLLYISDLGASDVDVYAYPVGRLKGTLTGFKGAAGECVDKLGDVYITETHASKIREYPHGGASPITTLKDLDHQPIGCAVDPMTGNLAVMSNGIGSSGVSDIAIYKNARGKPIRYQDPAFDGYSFCGYDGKGNLYFDGYDPHGAFSFGELPTGSATFTNIELNQTINEPGGVQWVGNDVAVGDQGMGYSGSTIYEFTISGSAGTLVGTTPLNGSSDVLQFWIQDKRVIGGSHFSGVGDVQYWSYPAGGTATKTIDGFVEPIGAVVSMAAKKST